MKIDNNQKLKIKMLSIKRSVSVLLLILNLNVVAALNKTGLNNREWVISFNGPNTSLWPLGRKNESQAMPNQCLTIEKSIGSRGFYIYVPNVTNPITYEPPFTLA